MQRRITAADIMSQRIASGKSPSPSLKKRPVYVAMPKSIESQMVYEREYSMLCTGNRIKRCKVLEKTFYIRKGYASATLHEN